MSGTSAVLVVDAPAAGAAARVRRVEWDAACASAGVALDATPPSLAARLRERGAHAVLVHDVPQADGSRQHWLDAPHARAWVTWVRDLPLAPDALAAGWATRLAEGHVAADAALLAGDVLPLSSWGERPVAEPRGAASRTGRPPGLYAIVATASQLREVVEAGVRTVQLRIKQPNDADAAWRASLADAIRQSVAVARAHDAALYVNDHWQLAAELGATAVHLGQQDLLELGDAGRDAVHATGMALGVSSHAMWELCRARVLQPAYIACGPVWPTTTKDMPWRPQGLDNLAYWVAHAGTPVVAIGGILTPAQVRDAARAGADGVCVLRGLGADAKRSVPLLQEALALGRQERIDAVPRVPHPTLDGWM